jgi:hypothetical protein
MYYSQINAPGSGLTNQLFSLITSILIAYYNSDKVIIVDYFSNDFSKTSFTPINLILNLYKINLYLKEKYDLIIIDKYNIINFKIEKITYGVDKNNIDITDIIKKNFFKNEILVIPKNTNFNKLCEDPCIGIQKNIFIEYKINNYYIKEIYNENLKNDIEINLINAKYKHTFSWIDNINKVMFEDILVNLKFNNTFINLSQNILYKINPKNKINLLHLKVENDAIKYYAKVHSMKEDEYKNLIENKYISLIKKYIDPLDENIILCGSLSNGIIDFLIKNNYKFTFNEKYFEEREKNAIIDFLMYKYCNNIFIGSFNFEKLRGSTFSYYIGKKINDNIKKIYIDQDNINDVRFIN